MIIYHIIALTIGIILDLIIGDPYRMPHPIRLIGKFIDFLDKMALPETIRSREEDTIERNPEEERKKGVKIVLTVTITVFILTLAVIICSYLISIYLGIAVEAILTAYVLAAKSLRKESMKVYRQLKYGTIENARYAVSMIVGRDTENLDASGVTRAAVETVAENTSDGVIAPLLYTFIGGPVLGLLYKSVNTMDSMIGYKNNRYINLGRAAALLDDAVNYVPARISARFIIFAAWFLHLFERNRRVTTDGTYYDPHEAVRIFKRDRFNHKSPNSAQTESAVAGALGLQLAGDAVYFGKVVKKPTIGDPQRSIEPEDIRRANNLMYAAFISCSILCLIILGAVELALH